MYGATATTPASWSPAPTRRICLRISVEEIRDGLDTLYPDMDQTEVAVLLREALAAAHLAGQFEVSEELL